MLSTRFRTVGLSLLAVAAATATLATSAAASATTATTSATATNAVMAGSYGSWSAAQHAARFRLLRPRTTFGLRMNGHVIVDRCLVSGHLKDRVVDAQYGSFTKHALGLEQDNAGVACTIGSGGAYLGKYKVAGATAGLHGYCGKGTPYSCKSVRIELWLTWKKNGKYYVASSFNESRKRLLFFARTLRRV